MIKKGIDMQLYRLGLLLTAICACLVLAGCGGSSNDLNVGHAELPILEGKLASTLA